jgi:hypothetical protein
MWEEGSLGALSTSDLQMLIVVVESVPRLSIRMGA